MEMIKKIVDQAEDEISGAMEYIKCAIKYKSEYPAIAQAYYEMSTAEMGHFNNLHEMVTRLIEDYKAKGVEIDKTMEAIYEYEHEKMMEKATKIRVMQDMFKK